MLDIFTSTIAAISSPRGKGGVALIRISGPDATFICDKFIHPRNGKTLSSLPANTATLSRITDEGSEVLDEGIITVFRAPRSYTGEDTVEICCHGGILLTETILTRALSCGAIQAGPGEFTRRAFSAGKLSLSEAEAVIGMIDAESRAAISLSRRNLDGSIRRQIDRLYERLRVVVSGVFAEIDFPDEDLSPLTETELRREIGEIKQELVVLQKSYKTGHAVCEGVKTVLFGKPNTGKSTVLNLLAGYERAIVTDIAGTTRDIVSETIPVGDVLLRLSDTAGFRKTADMIERLGVNRSVSALDDAELVIAVFDLSSPFDSEDQEVLSLLETQKARGAEILPILNKCDLAAALDYQRIERMLGKALFLSAKQPESRVHLANEITTRFRTGQIAEADAAVLTNARQAAAVTAALASLIDAESALDTLGVDTSCIDLTHAMEKLGETDGREVGIDVVDSIFHRFCVGK